MLFILRCTFWLAIVYASILWPGIFCGEADVTARSNMASVVALAGATDFCRLHAAACLGDAARLTALLEKTAKYRNLIAGSDEMAARDNAPLLPARAGRHHTRDERLARAP